jgi:hypothetical protein
LGVHWRFQFFLVGTKSHTATFPTMAARFFRQENTQLGVERWRRKRLLKMGGSVNKKRFTMPDVPRGTNF